MGWILAVVVTAGITSVCWLLGYRMWLNFLREVIRIDPKLLKQLPPSASPSRLRLPIVLQLGRRDGQAVDAAPDKKTEQA
ncbi:hypothetical protein [Nonomuraea gerenzanensis]|uniref:hypothetical protein n=1 Tax=Nonomuraea gerenzanensis TaxID=93944 RepID=UPI001CDA41B2|nr:hypothetical protein [Nonomuraea gerenzanensis]UBU12935.1 hypothetical protein LCN96_53290 [Nonomuraea gerenzanensis]